VKDVYLASHCHYFVDSLACDDTKENDVDIKLNVL